MVSVVELHFTIFSDPLALFFSFYITPLHPNTFPGSSKNGNLNGKEWRKREREKLVPVVGGSGHWTSPLTLFVWEFSFSTTRNFQSYMTTENREQNIFQVGKSKRTTQFVGLSMYVCTNKKKKWKLSCWYYLKLLTNLNSWKWCMYTILRSIPFSPTLKPVKCIVVKCFTFFRQRYQMEFHIRLFLLLVRNFICACIYYNFVLEILSKLTFPLLNEI